MYKPYTNERFERLSQQIDTAAKDILEAKKHVYSPDDDRLEDFHFVAQALGIRPAQVAAVYLLKHAQSLAVRIRNKDYQWYDDGGKEGLVSRAADIINLTKLLMACVDEEMVKEGHTEPRVRLTDEEAQEVLKEVVLVK